MCTKGVQMQNNIMEIIEAEIKASIKNEKPLYIELYKDEFVFKGVSSSKVEGEYILSSNGLDNIPVLVQWEAGLVSVTGVESEEKMLKAFLLKDNVAILRAVKEKLSRTELFTKPSFLVGPPGTGKSTVIVNTIKESIKNQRILVLSPTHMAVENVFERLDIDSLGLEDGEIVLNINTENESLASYSSDSLTNVRKAQIEDEQEMLNSAKEELLKRRRDLEVIVSKFESEIEQNELQKRNIKNDISEIEIKIKAEEKNLKDFNKRLSLIESNSIINSIAKVFLSGNNKVDELKNSISFSKTTIEKFEKNLKLKKEELSLINETVSESSYLEQKNQLKEIETAIKTVQLRLKELETEFSEFQNENIFSKARLVGATLVSAATNKKLQMAEFDKILIDESSMALFPLILSASQCLNQDEIVPLQIKYNPSLTEAQNKGVNLLVNSKLALIGDPRQLSPIAVTVEMRESVFDIYEVDKLFDGETVENTVLLDVNFRNHPDIVNLASNLFYGGLLKPGKKSNGLKSLYILNNKSQMTSANGSFVNKGNINLVFEQVEKALKKGRRSIGIVTPYKEQAKVINQRLEVLREIYPDADISAGTIHKFQGKEKDIIIFDLCFSATENAAIPKAYDGGLKSETAKLLNVAMTRAETFFILIGDVDGIKNINQKNFLLKDWIEKIEEL